MRRKPQRLEDVINDADLNKCKDKGKPEKEQNSIQKEKWAEKHGRYVTMPSGERHAEQDLRAVVEYILNKGFASLKLQYTL